MPKTIKQARDEAWDRYRKASADLEILERRVKSARYLNNVLKLEAQHAQKQYDTNPDGVCPAPEAPRAPV